MEEEGNDIIPQTSPKTEKKRPIRKARMSTEDIKYAKSRKQYMHLLTTSPYSTVFSLSTSAIKTGVANRGTQCKSDTFSEEIQTDPILTSDNFSQVPEREKKSRMPFLHFLKAASSTVCALIEQSEFSNTKGDSPFNQIGKFTTETMPLKTIVTPTRTFALVAEPSPTGRIFVWGARQAERSYTLISSANPSTFDVFSDSRYVFAGTESGSIVVWDLMRTELQKQASDCVIVQPCFTSESYGSQNHHFPIVDLHVFTYSGTSIACSLDSSGVVLFWFIQVDITGLSLVKAETVQVSKGFHPSYSLAIFPNSSNAFLVGGGGNIFNCCRFGSTLSPPVFNIPASVRSISFSHHIPTLFAAAADNGRVYIFDTHEENPLFTLTVNLSFGDLSVAWSPTRASVLFVSDLTGMKVYVFDLMQKPRSAVYMHKVGSAVQSISAVKSRHGVVLAIAEGANCVSVFRVSPELSKPLSEEELNMMKVQLYSSCQ